MAIAVILNQHSWSILDFLNSGSGPTTKPKPTDSLLLADDPLLFPIQGTFCKVTLPIIGASLSEPHTSVTALRTRVYVGRTIYLSIYGPTTYRKF